MAEAPTPTSTTSSPPATPKGKQYIRATNKDDELEPDALRGSEQVIKDAGVQDDDEERRAVYKKDEKK